MGKSKKPKYHIDIYENPSDEMVDTHVKECDFSIHVGKSDMNTIESVVHETVNFCEEKGDCILSYGHLYPEEHISTFGIKVSGTNKKNKKAKSNMYYKQLDKRLKKRFGLL